MSVMNVTKFHQLAVSVRSGFGGVKPNSPSILLGQGDDSRMIALVPSPSPDAPDQEAIVPNLRKEAGPGGGSAVDTSSDKKDKKLSADDIALQKMLAAIQAAIVQNHLSGDIQAKNDERGIVITLLTDKFLFDKGMADLRPQSLWILDFVGKEINVVPNAVRVEGHTDNLPIHTAQFRSNWELSTTRATNVLEYLLGHDGIAARRLSAAGYADTRPVMPNDNEPDRARNRRVDIVILRRRADNND
jgi:chemotaxis protein MotB